MLPQTTPSLILNLGPRILPSVIWQNVTLLKGDDSLEPIELSHLPLPDVLESLGTEFTLVDLSNIYKATGGRELDWPRLASLAKCKWSRVLEKTLHRLAGLPSDFQRWCKEKLISSQDLAPLLSVSENEFPVPFLSILAAAQVSRQNGLKILEWAVELFLMGEKIQRLLPEEIVNADLLLSDSPLTLQENFSTLPINGEKWKEQLYLLRFKKTVAQDLIAKEALSEFHLPKFVKAQWQRRGDLTGVEIKIFATRPEQMLERLEKVKEAFVQQIAKANPDESVAEIESTLL